MATRRVACCPAGPRLGRTSASSAARFVPETLIPALDELDGGVPQASRADPAFRPSSTRLLAPTPAGPRRSPRCRGFAEHAGGRAGLPQARGPQPHRLAQDQQRARPGAAGQAHGQDAPHRRDRAPASTAWPRPRAAALLGLECVVYMGEVDIERAGAQRLPHAPARRRGRAGRRSGRRTLKDAVNEALRDWVANRRRPPTTCLGSVMGPHPYPWMVREFHQVIGERGPRRSARADRRRCPTSWSRAWAGGPTPSASSTPSLDDGRRAATASRPAATARPGGRRRSSRGAPGVAARRAKSYLMQDEDGQTLRGQSISAGLDYPGVGPEHAWLHDIGRAELPAGDRRRGHRGVPAPRRTEGIIPALESAHALAGCRRGSARGALAGDEDAVLLVNLSGRGDKDVAQVARAAWPRSRSRTEHRRLVDASRRAPVSGTVGVAVRAPARRARIDEARPRGRAAPTSTTWPVGYPSGGGVRPGRRRR